MHQNYRKLKRDFVVRNKDKKQAEKKIEDLQRKSRRVLALTGTIQIRSNKQVQKSC